MSFAVVSCRKYSHRSIRVVNFGDRPAADVIRDLQPRECPICGPLSHTELAWEGYWEVHGEFPAQEVAVELRRSLLASQPDQYRDE